MDGSVLYNVNFLPYCSFKGYGKLFNEFAVILAVVNDSASWLIALNKILRSGPQC
jgi:hypothetical protein